jgi:hypothetical protein
MNKLLLLFALLLLLGGSSCASSNRLGGQPGRTPRPWLRYYKREQRQNERQRRRVVKSNITWSKI